MRLVLRAIRWRAGAAGAVLAVAVIAVAAAALGPLYLHAVDGGILRQTLAAAPRSDADLFAYVTSSPLENVDWASAMNDLVAPLRGSRWFLPALQRRQAEITVKAPDGGHYATRLVHVEGDCAHLHFVSGRCPQRPGEIAVSKRTTGTGLGLGDSFPVELAAGKGAVDVVGVYEPIEPTGTFWGGADLFDAKPTTSDTVAPRIDSFFVASATLDQLSATVPIDYVADVPLVVDSVRLSDVDALGTLVSNAEDAGRQAQGIGGSVASGVPHLLDDVRTGERIPATLVLVASVQLALLALAVLAVVVWNIASTRASEAALAKLRGRRSAAVAVLATGEPVAMVLLAWPIGVLVARVVVGALAPTLVGDGAKVTVTANAVALGAAITAAAVVVCIAAASQLLRASVASLFRHSADSSRSATVRLMGEAVVLVLAAGGSFELQARGLATTGKPDALAVIVPTLIAAAAAILMLHLMPLALRPFVNRTRDTSQLTSFLVVRQLSRRPTGLRIAAVVAVATGIAMFAATSWATAAHNLELRAKG
ncbi:MAG TPA: hypothetical protein VN738_10625, partial [Acidothermaceae bacterium]|nr:hypothetical protein [Acidothermaceae bacterium]